MLGLKLNHVSKRGYWSDVDQDLSRHMASQGLNELKQITEFSHKRRVRHCLADLYTLHKAFYGYSMPVVPDWKDFYSTRITQPRVKIIWKITSRVTKIVIHSKPYIILFLTHSCQVWYTSKMMTTSNFHLLPSHIGRSRWRHTTTLQHPFDVLCLEGFYGAETLVVCIFAPLFTCTMVSCGCLAKPSLKLGHVWIITLNIKQWMQSFSKSQMWINLSF